MRKLLGVAACAASLLMPTTMAAAAKKIDVGVTFGGGTNTNIVVYGSTGSDVVVTLAGKDSSAVPLPEPASWAMMMIGLGSIGFAMRRRTTRAISFG